MGSNSFNAILLRKISAPVIYTLTSDTVFKNNSGYCPSSQCYAITIEQPTERYVSLIYQLFGKVKTINYISSNIASDDRVQAIRQQAAKYGIKTRVTEHKSSPDNFNFNIDLDDNDVLLALPDPLIYNRHTAKNIILSAYHNNASIVAYSAAFTKSGALASLYSSIDDIAESTYNTTLKVLSEKQLNRKIIRPEHFSVLTNKAVARSMGLTLKNEEQLKESIR